jgi:hypothetical protein
MDESDFKGSFFKQMLLSKHLGFYFEYTISPLWLVPNFQVFLINTLNCGNFFSALATRSKAELLRN